jgi:hypothetical protein
MRPNGSFSPVRNAASESVNVESFVRSFSLVIVRTNWMRAVSGGGGQIIFVSLTGCGADAQPARIAMNATMVAAATPGTADLPTQLRLPNIAISFESGTRMQPAESIWV